MLIKGDLLFGRMTVDKYCYWCIEENNTTKKGQKKNCYPQNPSNYIFY